MLIVRVLPDGPTYECEAILQDEDGAMILFSSQGENQKIYQECSVTPEWSILDEEKPC